MRTKKRKSTQDGCKHNEESEAADTAIIDIYMLTDSLTANFDLTPDGWKQYEESKATKTIVIGMGKTASLTAKFEHKLSKEEITQVETGMRLLFSLKEEGKM